MNHGCLPFHGSNRDTLRDLPLKNQVTSSVDQWLNFDRDYGVPVWKFSPVAKRR